MPKQQLTYPLDRKTIDVLNRYIREKAINFILDIVWRSHFYFFTAFESSDRFLTSATGSFQGVTSDGLELEVDSGSSNTTELTLSVPDDTLIDYTKRTRIRTAVQVSSVSDFEVSAGNRIRFLIDDDVIKGFVSDGSNTSFVTLGTAATGTFYELEARYFPNDKTVFYLDKREAGVITDRFPAGNTILCSFSIERTAGSATKNANMSFFEMIQGKL